MAKGQDIFYVSTTSLISIVFRMAIHRLSQYNYKRIHLNFFNVLYF